VGKSDSSSVTVFVCANCARPGKEVTSAFRTRPAPPDFHWPRHFQQVTIPCAGRIQPEHVLRAFESGDSIVLVVACQEDNCHYVEGSRRCALRVEYIRSILQEIGLGDGRLLFSYLPGSACEDLAVSVAKTPEINRNGSLQAQIASIRDQVFQALDAYPHSPLGVQRLQTEACDE
jgi:F420-non-reducing hydrogenase iron-sulfur subunit